MLQLIVTTTPNVDGRSISQYLGLVSGTVLALVGIASKGHQKWWDPAIKSAQEFMESQAKDLGADAIVGVKIDMYKTGTADFLYITGTAVNLN